MKAPTIITIIPQIRIEAADLIMVRAETDNLEDLYHEIQDKDLNIVNISFRITTIRECRKSFPTKYTHYDVIDSFCKFLVENNQMHNFVNLATGLIENKIDPKNLDWQSALHMGQYSACSTTTAMRYDPEYIEFMAVMNLLFGSSALNVL